jgi:glycoside hydrolase-like protein/putative peptidoglycan binding protein
MNAFDTSFSPPDYMQAKAAGYSLALRYLVYPLPNGKVIDPDETKRIHDAGLALSLNWECDAGDSLRGHAGGVADATHAMDEAKNWIKYPKGQVIWYSVGDSDIQPNQFATVAAYLDGVREVHQGYYEIGAYGGAGLLKFLKQHGKADYFWQAVAPYGWYDNRSRWPDAHLWQTRNEVALGGGHIDIDEVNTAAGTFPVWAPPTATASPTVVGPNGAAQEHLAIAFIDDSKLDTVGGIIREIVEAAAAKGLLSKGVVSRLHMTSNLRGCSDVDYHEHCSDDKGAADIAEATTDQGNRDMRDLAAFFYNYPSYLLELIHTTPYATDNGFYVKDGKRVDEGYYDAATRAAHLNHVHVAGAEGSLRELLTNIEPGSAPWAATAPPFPLSGHDVFGLITGPDWMHGGINGSEKSQVKKIQLRLQALGYAPNTAGWADGVYEHPTAEGVERFQAAKGLPVTGYVDKATWLTLFS